MKDLFPTTVERVLFLKEIDLFSDTTPDSLIHVSSIANEFQVSKNEEIFKRGDPSVYLYLIVSGRVKITREGRELFEAGPSESFGLIGLIEERRRATTATALENTQLLRISHTDFFDLMEDYPAITKGVLRGISKVLRELL